MIGCLVLSKMPLDNLIKKILFEGARKMFSGEFTQLEFQTDLCCGIITTNFKDGDVGGFFGLEFEVSITTADAAEIPLSSLYGHSIPGRSPRRPVGLWDQTQKGSWSSRLLWKERLPSVIDIKHISRGITAAFYCNGSPFTTTVF